jgi:hypothetical protein
MPKFAINDQEFIVSLSPWERLWALRWEVRIPLNCIRTVEIDPKAVPWTLGLRAPGSFFPGVIAAGTYWKPKNKQFAYWTRGDTPVVLTLSGAKFGTLILGSKNPKGLADQINEAIQAKN